MSNVRVILTIAGAMFIMVAVAAGPDGGKLPERPLGTAQESIGRTSAALGQELDTIGPGFLAEKQAIDRKAARKAPTPVGASQVQDAPLPALDTSSGQVSARSAGVPFVQAEIVDQPLPRFQIADDGLLLRPNHPPLDQIPPAPMPMTVDQRALADPGAPVFHDAITGETIVLPIDRAISSDKLGMIPGYDGADGGLGSEDRTRTFWDMSRVTNTDDFPWRMNAKLVMRFVDQSDSDRWFGCSGSMIDAETVLCAGHCVYLRAVDGPDIFDWAKEIWVYPGKDGNEHPYGYGHGTDFGAWTGWTQGGSFDYDAGLIGITRAVGMLTGWFGKAWDGSCSWVLGQTYNNASYPGENCPDPGLHTGVDMYYWYGHFDSCPGNQLQINTGGGHCFDTVWGGMSGSGAYYIDNGSRYVHAVCSNSNRTTSGRYCKLWGNWASFMNGEFIPDVRGGFFDLQALDANAEPATVPAGSALSLADFLAANPTNASASGTWTVRTYLSTNDDISSGDTLLGTGFFNWNFGLMSSVRVGLGNPTIPINTPPGDYWFGVELDPATDGNSSNNSTNGWDAVPLTVTPAPPPNDDCGSAITIPSTPIMPYDPPLLDTRGATSAASDPLQTCTYNGPNRNSNTVWYVYTPPCDGLVNVSTCGSSYDTVVSVFTGSCGSLSEIGCNDDSCGYQSEITGLAVTGLQPIYIDVSDYNLPGGGDLDFHLDFVPTGIPSNDDCANAQYVGIPSSTIGTTNCAMVDDYAPDCPDQAPPYYPVNVTSPGVWYRVIGTGRMLTATTCNDFPSYDTKISVYCNSCDTLTCVAGNDDNCTGYPPVLSTVSWCSQYGAEYLILVHGFYGRTGGFLLDVYQGDAPCSDAVECGGEPIGACCAPYACTEGGTCGTGFNWCGGSFDCLCVETAEGSASCTNDRACAGLTSCPNGTSDCAAGEACYVNTCCVGPVCAPDVCAIVGSSATATPDGATMGGRSAADRRGVVACEDRRESSCEARGGLYQGDGVSCAQTACPGPTGACCVDGDCVGTMEEPYCLRQGGEWFPGEDCATFLCPEPPPMGACCAPWVCTEGFVCEGDHLPVCNGTFGPCFCFNTAEGGLACLDAWNQGCGEPCDATMSCPVGYVCVVDTCCEVDGERVPVCLKEGCPLSDPTGQISALGEAGSLGELSIEQPAAERGVEQQDCIDVEQAQCDSLVGLYQGDDTICEDTVCPGPPHACCLPDGRCAEASHRKCVEHGGDPQGPGTTCDMIVCQPLKWSQPPVFGMTPQFSECFLGWDEQSIYRSQQIVADDWLCSNDQPVTDVHWWGSYLQWSQTEPPQEGAPKGFHIGIWTDVAAGGQLPFSHPGKMIHEWVVERSELNERAVGCDYYPEHSVDTCFRYDFVIPTRDQWFSQESACEIYWVSIAAIYADVPSRNPWGWKTRKHLFNDAAVRIYSPTDPSVPAEFHEGKPIEDPLGVRWDMAFVLTTTLPEQGCCLNDGDCIDVSPHACLRLQGVPQGEGTICTQSQACCLDDSTCIDVDPLCCDDLGGIRQGVGTQCTVEEACCLPDGTCRMLDPLCCGALNGTPQGAGTTCTEPEGCCLGNGTCLDLDPLCCDEFGGTPQGSGTACVDTTIACCNIVGASCIETDPLCCDEMGGVPSPIGSAVCLGDGDGNGIDDACEVPPQACCLRDGSCVDTDHNDCVDQGGDPQGPRTRCDGVTCQPLKWSQPPMFNPGSQYPDCFWGWDEMSIYRGQQIVADDWLCDDTQPVTDIHWWGSYYRWSSPEPPQDGPKGFHIGVWTDVPAGAHGLLFSHPGKMIQEWVVDRRALRERVVGCDFYPERPRDTCFRYDFIIPREKWFYQEAACEIYWISIAAIYPDDYFGRSFWGWKTRKYRFGDTAVRIFSPTGPTVPGFEFQDGQPIEDPPHVPWDMAFVLTTTHATEACCLQDQSCLDVVREVCMEMGGKPQGRDTECTQPQACCLDDGTCIDIDPLCCDDLGGIPQGVGTQCTVEQACCLPDAACKMLDPLCCRNMGGRPQGAGTDCTEPEACCLRDGKCLDVDPLCCDEFGGEPQGSGTACEGDLDGNGIDEACELDDVCEDCGPGPHWVDQCAAGSDDMPSGALVGIDLDLDCQVDVSMVLSGAVKILRSDPLDVSAQFANVGTLDYHTDVIDTEIVSMSLANLATGVTLTAGAGTGQGGVLGPSLGAIAEQAGDPTIADSFFDVLFEVGLDDDRYVYNHTPLRVDTKIICVPPDATYIHPVGCIPLYDTPLPDQGTVVANLVTADHSSYPGCGDPTTGDCFDPNNGTPYCDDAECCEAVCQQLPHCCELIWDTDCTGVAVEVCHPREACCLPDGTCIDVDPASCQDEGGTPQGAGTKCADVQCPQPECEPMPDGSACWDAPCPGANDVCQPRCMLLGPTTGQATITDCECRAPGGCHVEPDASVGPGSCVVPDNGTGTITLPPQGCEYLSPDEVHEIIDGLPPGTTIELDAIHKDFLCVGGDVGVCSVNLPPGQCETPLGTVPGHVDCFESTLELSVNGTGSLAGFNRTLWVPISCEVHTGPRNPGDPVQTFSNDMFRLQGELFGDHDFCRFRVVGGTDFGFPGPGHTTLTQLPSGDFAVDSFFDITYKIEFEGCEGSQLDTYMGTTTATIRMQTTSTLQPGCVGDCPTGMSCQGTVSETPNGEPIYCCDCAPEPIEACCLPDGQCAELTPTDCRVQFGIPQGPGTTCADVECPLPPVIEIDPFNYSIGEFEVSGPFGTEIIHVSGQATVHVFFEDSTEGTADDDDTNGFDEVTIQMVDLNLTGLSPLLGPVHVTLNPNLPSFGEIEETANNTSGILDLPPFAPTGTANSYFNLFFKIEVGGQTYFTIDPKRMSSVITHKPPGPTDLYENLDRIELYDENGDPTGVFLDASRHRPNPPEACCLPDGRCREIPVGECFDSDGLPLGPATLCEGDSNQNEIDDACEEEHVCADCGPGDHLVDDCAGGNDNMPTSAIVGIDLNGDCQPDASMVLSGPVSIWRSNPRDASWQFMGVGVLDSHTDVIDTEIVSMSLTNAAFGVTLTVGAGLGQGGVLPASFGAILEQEGDPAMADSFFDVFFEADLGGARYAYNHVPLRVSTKIDCLPPDAVYIHPVVCIPLFDAAGNQVGNLVTADHSTYPECGDPTTGNCFEPNGTPYCDDAECCRAVCEQLPHCCDVAWDQHCAAAAQEICRPCPQAGIIETMPPNGVVDARQPNTPRASLPRQGIGTEDEPIVVTLDPPVTDAAHCFNLCETGVDQLLGPNYIVSVSGSGTGQYKIVLHHAITAGAVTTIQYKGGGSYVEFTSHPANVNADSAATPSDILRVIDYINGVATSPWGIYSEDVDRSNLLGPPDILRVIDLLNGAGVFDSWLNSPLPVNTSCP